MSSDKQLRLAIVGCGAVAQKGHLPASCAMDNARVTVLVDTNQIRCHELAQGFGIEHTSDTVDKCLNLFDAAIVALPHVLHAAITIKLLNNGKSVLVEKPMAVSVKECHAMIAAASESRAVLGVGLMRRFLTTHRIVHSLLSNGLLGRINRFDFAEGEIYDWPVASDFFFRKDSAAGGVLIDTGAHTLDSLLHWLGEFVEVEYFDDAQGGIEANCMLKLRMENGSSGTVEMSRTRQLRNTAIICGEQGTLEVGLDRNSLRFQAAGDPYVVRCSTTHVERSDQGQGYLDTITEQMKEWVDAVFEERPPFVDASSAVPSVRLIETCYAKRQPLFLPWEHPEMKNNDI
jgi:predicted dehydrogenase